MLNWEEDLWYLSNQMAFSLPPQKARLCQTHQSSKTGKTDASLLDSPGKVGTLNVLITLPPKLRAKILHCAEPRGQSYGVQATLSIVLQEANLCLTLRALRPEKQKPALWRFPLEKLECWTCKPVHSLSWEKLGGGRVPF